MAPADPSAEATEATIGRMTMRKTWHGDLEGRSAGEFLGVRSSVAGSAGYVAIERFEGALAGRKGSFLLVHRGLMDRGTGTASIDVVPDSGTAELEGLHGTLTITIASGDHRYELRWSTSP